MNIEVRESTAADSASIESIYSRAFPEEDLIPLLRELFALPSATMSLVAADAQRVLGNIVFTDCGVAGRTAKMALLGPLAVDPDAQGRRIGTTLIDDGMQRLSDAGYGAICVLGDPNYYGRFGFVAEHAIQPPYPLPSEWAGAWQSLRPKASVPAPAGTLQVPAPWQQPALWLP